MKKFYILFYIVLVCISLFGIADTFTFDSFRATIFPTIVSSALVVLLCISYYRNWMLGRIAKGTNPDSQVDLTNSQEENTSTGRLKALLFFAIVLAFSVLSYLFSFLYLIPVFVGLWTWYSGYRAYVVFLHTVSSFSIYYFIFYEWLDIPLHKGWWL